MTKPECQFVEAELVAHYLGPDKKSQSVQEHLEEVASFASVFAGKIGLPSMGELAGILHDLGKYSKAFQKYIQSAEGKLDPDAEPANAIEQKGKIDHSTAGAQMIWETLKDHDQMSNLTVQVIALCIASHHSGLIDCLSPDGEDKFSVRMAKGKGETHLDEVREVGDKQILDRVTNALHSYQYVAELKGQLARLLDVKDSPVVREFYVGLLVRFIFSALIDADRLSAAGRSRKAGNGPRWDILTARLEKHITGLEQRNWVDDIRSEISLACQKFASREKGLYQLTVPTGGAKTLSSLRFGLHHAAHHQMDRLIYVIPYTSIIDQNAAIARSILEEATDGHSAPIVLEHHSNLVPEEETWQSKLLAENWDATVIFTTTVQFLETLFAGRTRGVRRMHNLANAVIVFDEIQTLPVKTVHLFNNAINFLVRQCGSTVVFCTATQPLLHVVDSKKGAARLTEKPEMAPRRDELFNDLSRRVEVLDKRKNGGWTESEITELVCDEARESGSALVIVNTKAAARTIYDLCKQQIDSVYHLSTNMCPVHRLKIINDIKQKLDPKDPEPKKPMVCVSTQLIEAGVDIDFGSVVRYMAGLPSIAQAAGRCNRNCRRSSGKVLIVNPSRESLDKLPEIRIGREMAERVLDEYRRDPDAFDHDLLSPRAMERYYKYYFFDRAHEMDYRVSAKEIGHDDDLVSLLSTNPRSIAAYARANKTNQSTFMPLLKQSFKSAGSAFKVIDTPTEGIVVPYGKEGKKIIAELCAAASIEEIRGLLKEAQRYSVNLYPNDREKLYPYETQKGSGIFYLDERYYSEDMGVVFDQKQPMDFLNG